MPLNFRTTLKWKDSKPLEIDAINVHCFTLFGKNAAYLFLF